MSTIERLHCNCCLQHKCRECIVGTRKVHVHTCHKLFSIWLNWTFYLFFKITSMYVHTCFMPLHNECFPVVQTLSLALFTSCPISCMLQGTLYWLEGQGAAMMKQPFWMSWRPTLREQLIVQPCLDGSQTPLPLVSVTECTAVVFLIQQKCGQWLLLTVAWMSSMHHGFEHFTVWFNGLV